MSEEIKITIIATGFEQQQAKPVEPVIVEEPVVEAVQFTAVDQSSVPPLLRTYEEPIVQQVEEEEIIEDEDDIEDEVTETEHKGIELPPFMRRLFGKKK